jgi:DNA-directed RNA polymerase specialized sigma24 family protein
MSLPLVSGIRPHRQAILELHGEGKTIQQLSTQLGENFGTIHRVLRQAGRMLRKPSERPRSRAPT